MAVINARQSRNPANLPAKPVPRTWFNSFPARAVLRAVAVTFTAYWQALAFAIEHEGHAQYFTVQPGRARVICGCGEERWL